MITQHFWKLTKASKVYPLFVLDPKFCQGQMNVNRHSFLLQSLSDLDKSLRELGSRLFVVRGKPEEQIPLLAKKWNVDLVTFEECSGPYSQKRDAEVTKFLRDEKIKVSTYDTHTLFALEHYIDHAGKNLPKTYAKFGDLFNSLGKVRQPAPSPTAADFAAPVGMDSEEFDVPSLQDIGYASTDIPTATKVFPWRRDRGLEALEAESVRSAQVDCGV